MIGADVISQLKPSSAVTREGALADFFFQNRSHAGDGGRGDEIPVSWQVLELDVTFPETLRPVSEAAENDFPSAHAMDIARSLCRDVDRILGNIVTFSDIEAFEGDLLVHWRSSDRWITLICPSGRERKTKLYREELNEAKLLKSETIIEPQASDIAEAIRWVWGAA